MDIDAMVTHGHTDKSGKKCYNCGKLGHFSNANSPGNYMVVHINHNSKTTKGNRNKDKGHNRNRL